MGKLLLELLTTLPNLRFSRKTLFMKCDYEIIVFSDDWNGLPFSCKHLLSHFLPEIPLIWVETIGLRSPKLNLYDIKRAFEKFSGWLFSTKSPDVHLPENLNILNPFQIPYNHYGIVRRLNKVKMIHSLECFNKGRFSRYRVLITTWPFLGDVIGRLGEHLSIYYRVDDFSEFPGVRKDYIRQVEKELIEKVDMMVAASQNLTEIGNNEKVIKYLPHGVDFQHFTAGAKDVYGQGSLQNIPAPRIGFFGMLDSWIDFDLISRVAIDHPDWSFVFVGPSQLSSSALPSIPNIYFLGPVLYEHLPSYARYFDVALIPFKINTLTISVNPLKLMEYFSLGLPVVSTPLPEVTKYQDHVFIASDPKAFGDAIKKALKEDDQNTRISRQKIAESQSWKKKALQLRSWIETALEQKVGNSC